MTWINDTEFLCFFGSVVLELLTLFCYILYTVMCVVTHSIIYFLQIYIMYVIEIDKE